MSNENINDNKGPKTIKVRSGELNFPTSEEVRSALEAFLSAPETFFSAPARKIEKPIFTLIEPDKEVFEELEVTKDSADTEIDGTWHQTCVLPDLDDDLVYVPDDPNDIRRILERFFSTSGMNIVLPDRRAVEEPTFAQIESGDEVIEEEPDKGIDYDDYVIGGSGDEINALDDPIEILGGSDNPDSSDDLFDELVLGDDEIVTKAESDFLLEPSTEEDFDESEDFLLEPWNDDPDRVPGSSQVIALDSSPDLFPEPVQRNPLLSQEQIDSGNGLSESEVMNIINGDESEEIPGEYFLLKPDSSEDLPGSSEVIVLEDDADIADFIGSESDAARDAGLLYPNDAYSGEEYDWVDKKEKPKKRRWQFWRS
jgi:hypothetical protein